MPMPGEKWRAKYLEQLLSGQQDNLNQKPNYLDLDSDARERAREEKAKEHERWVNRD